MIKLPVPMVRELSDAAAHQALVELFGRQPAPSPIELLAGDLRLQETEEHRIQAQVRRVFGPQSQRFGG